MKAIGADTLAGRLARSMTFWVAGVWLACVLGVVWYIGSEIDYNFDSELVEVSHRMFDIALDRLDSASVQNGAACCADAPWPLWWAALACLFTPRSGAAPSLGALLFCALAV